MSTNKKIVVQSTKIIGNLFFSFLEIKNGSTVVIKAEHISTGASLFKAYKKEEYKLFDKKKIKSEMDILKKELTEVNNKATNYILDKIYNDLDTPNELKPLLSLMFMRSFKIEYE